MLLVDERVERRWTGVGEASLRPTYCSTHIQPLLALMLRRVPHDHGAVTSVALYPVLQAPYRIVVSRFGPTEAASGRTCREYVQLDPAR